MESAKSSPRPYFLVVDDSITILKFSKCILSTSFPESKVDLASNAQQALELMESSSYDVVVMVSA